MNDKDYNKLIKDYEKLHYSRPDIYIMDYRDGFLTRSEKVQARKLLDQNKEDGIRILLT